MSVSLEDLYQACRLNGIEPKDCLVEIEVGDSYYNFGLDETWQWDFNKDKNRLTVSGPR